MRKIFLWGLLGLMILGPIPPASRTGYAETSAKSGAKSGDGDGISDLEQAIKDQGGDNGAAKGDSSGGKDDLALPDDSGAAAGANGPAEGADTAKASPGDDDTSALEPKGKDSDASADTPSAGDDASGKNSSASSDSDDQAPPNHIVSVEFKMDKGNSIILLQARGELSYREEKNESAKQLVYFFDNTTASQRLQRAFDTSEFLSPVGLFTLLEMPGSKPPLTKLIVQLRENKAPTVTPSKNGLEIRFPAPTDKGEPKLIIGDDDSNTAIEDNIYNNSKTFNGKTLKLLEVKNSDIHDVLRMLARTSGYNIVVGDDVQGQVGTLSLENVPWDQAFALVLQSKKLGYIRQGNVIRVATLASLKSEKDDSLANEQAKIKVEPLHTVLIPISYAKASDVADKAKSFLTPRGTIDTDGRTNTVIIRDIDSVVSRVQKLFAALDTQPPRISISAKVVEMEAQFTRNIGVNYLNMASSNTSGLNFQQAITNSGGGVSQTTLTAAQFANLNTQIQLGEVDNRTRTLANPAVSVIANQSATVNQTISLFVLAPTLSAAPIGGSTAPQALNTVTEISATLSLNVLPIVANDGSIFLKVDVKNEIPTGQAPNISVNGRSVSTQILLDNGDTAVLGGIFQNTVQDSKTGIPWLMRIPLLGYLFSEAQTSDDRAETYIFLTAKIMNADDSFKRTL